MKISILTFLISASSGTHTLTIISAFLNLFVKVKLIKTVYGSNII